MTQATDILCIYCGKYKRRSREHVVLEALGGVDVIENVCNDCNALFATNDKTLAVDSPLSLFVRRELQGVGPNTCDIDHNQQDLLLEAQTTPGEDSVTLKPQIIFDKNNTLAYFGFDDVLLLGVEELMRRLYTRLRRAYGHYKIYGPNARKRDHRDQDMIKLMKQDAPREEYRLPPRIYCNKNVRDYTSKPIMFGLKYVNDIDKTRVLDLLSNVNWSQYPTNPRMYTGSEMPEIRLNYSINGAIQALVKIGLNLLAFFCRSTKVNIQEFRSAVTWIMNGESPMSYQDLTNFGFIRPDDVIELRCPEKSHKFRLVHDQTRNLWKFYAALFEGKVATYVEFSGPNKESWATMDVVQPYKRLMSAPRFDNWYLPLKIHAVVSPLEVLSTVALQNAEVRLLARRA